MSGITDGEKELLVRRIIDAVSRNVLNREEMIEILRICREACDRRIAEIEEATKKNGPVQ